MSVSVVEQPGVRRPRPAQLSRPIPSPAAPEPADSREERRQVFREWGLAAGSSILLHLLLVLILAAMLIVLPGSGSDLVIQSAINPGDPKGEQLDSVLFETPALEDKALDGIGTSEAAAEAASLDPRSDGVNPAELAGAALAANGADGPKVGFFGTREAGVSFVFVVDRSGSMDDPAEKGSAKTRFARALEELQKSLDDLQSWQKFGIIFYSNGPVPLFAPDEPAKLYPASRSMRKKTLKWMRQLFPAGGTEPAEALQQALNLQPDVIFFLTDGEIPDDVRDIVKQANRYKTIVHTVAFSSREGELILKGIAEDNRGKYRYVR